FNLFGELQQDLALASRVFGTLSSGRLRIVDRIEFEHSPGRRDLAFTGDNSAFDVFIDGRNAADEQVFIGIEVKYHESLRDKEAEHRARYEEVAEAMGCFRQQSWAALKRKPLQQIL